MAFKKILAGLISFFAFLFVFVFVLNEKTNSFDSAVEHFFHPFHFLEVFGILGSKTVIAAGSIAMILYLWWVRKNFYGIALMLVGVAGGNMINSWLKNAVMRDRPSLAHGEEGYSFPSGHAMVGIIFYLVIVYLILENTKSNAGKMVLYLAAFVLVLLAGLSRVVTYAHYPTDVIGGYLFGFAIFMFITVIYEKIKK